MDLELKDKVAVVTGGSTGIGRAVARGLAREGVHVVLCARDETRVVEEARAIEQQYGTKALGVRADVIQPADLAFLASEVERVFQGADILINNAGTGTDETIMQAPDEKWYHYWDLHVMAAVRLARMLVPAMRRRGGGVGCAVVARVVRLVVVEHALEARASEGLDVGQAGLRVLDRSSEELDATPGRALHAGRDPEEGALARAVGAHQAGEGARSHVQRDTAENLGGGAEQTTGEALLDSGQLEGLHHPTIVSATALDFQARARGRGRVFGLS